MKKLLITFLIFGFLSFPFISFAQSISNQKELKAQIVRLKIQILQLRIQQLQKQLQILLENSLKETDTSTKIISVNVSPGIDFTKIEWQTNKRTESRIYITGGNAGGNLVSKMFFSESGISTNHVVSIIWSDLLPETNYSYEITAINEDGFVKRSGKFKTSPAPILDISIDKNKTIMTIVTKLTNGQIIPNRRVFINSVAYFSDNDGIIIYKIQQQTDHCITEVNITLYDGHQTYLKRIQLEGRNIVGVCA